MTPKAPPTDGSASSPADPSSMSYEAARAELASVVEQLQGGTPALEEALALWERGELLARRCEEILEAARLRVEQVTGESTAAPTRDG